MGASTYICSFFEQALRNLESGGRLVFITPEKYHYVASAGPLRELLARYALEEICLVREDTFGKLVTYPTITVLKHAPPQPTQIVRRDGSSLSVSLPPGQQAWQALFVPAPSQASRLTLGEVCVRISCGVATGADSVFVHTTASLDPDLLPFTYPTLAGRQLTPATSELPTGTVMLIPYDKQGCLLALTELGALGHYLMRPSIRERLLQRTCVRHKPWYAFHETP